MLNARLTPDNKWIIVDTENKLELKQLRLSFTKKIPNWFILKKQNPYARVDETFMNAYGMIPVGLWLELVNICKKFKLNIQFENDFNCKIKDCNIIYDDFIAYVNKLFEKSAITPMPYQLDGIFNILTYKNCCVEVSTSGGKTLMTYILFRYMKDVLGVKHILFVTPKTNLTTQSADKFIEYDKTTGLETDWNSSEIHANAKKQKEYDQNIVFGNYQSLCRKKPEFFEKFDAVITDECHHGTSKSIININRRCKNAKYKIGLTGTFPKEGSYENFVLQSNIGPVVYRLTSFDLINKENFATPVYVTGIYLKYLDKEHTDALYNLRTTKDRDDPTAGGKLLNMEKDLMRENKARFYYVSKMIMNTKKNSLGIFSDVQNEYGKKIYNYIKENSDKNVYYIDGSTPTKNREYIKECMEKDDDGNTIIIASMGCFTEGIDIANVWNIFLLESTKSETILAQLLGRGMRRHPKKDKTMMIDFIDDFRPDKVTGYYADNYLYKHGKDRQSIYKRRGFPFNSFSIDLAVRNVTGVSLVD